MSKTVELGREKITTTALRQMKAKGERIAMITAYDYPTARILDEAGAEILLVGDSLGNVVLGYENTLAVTVEDILHHSKAVVRGARRAMVVADMPFMSYQISVPEALRNAGRFLQEGGAQGIKLEGGAAVVDRVGAMTSAGIPVMGHLGLTPQSVHQLGGYLVQGKTSTAAQKIVDDARRLEEAGAFSIVLECVPLELASAITQAVSIPTIGIGAGAECDGQVLVIHDICGLSFGHTPKFVKVYADLGSAMSQAAEHYIREVKSGEFPAREQSFTMPASESAELSGLYGGGRSKSRPRR